MTKTKEELKEKLIITELRGGEGPTDGERVPDDLYEGDQDTADTTPEEAERAADTGKKIIEEMRKHGL